MLVTYTIGQRTRDNWVAQHVEDKEGNENSERIEKPNKTQTSDVPLAVGNAQPL